MELETINEVIAYLKGRMYVASEYALGNGAMKEYFVGKSCGFEIAIQALKDFKETRKA
jgi:hypothetical protein